MLSKDINIAVWSIIIIGIVGLIFNDLYASEMFFKIYKTIIELYLFSFTSFLILKRVFFYKLKGNVDVIRLIKKSECQPTLIWQGLILATVYLTYNQYFYGNLFHFNSVLIAILLLFYLVQLIINSNPSIYIDEESFSYDDFFVQRWPWQKTKSIELENQKMRLVGANKNFEIDFDHIDDIDYIKLNEEVEHNVLDGDFASEETSKTLVDIVHTYANLYNVRFVNSTKKVL